MKTTFTLFILINLLSISGLAQNDCGTVVPEGYMEKLGNVVSTSVSFKSNTIKEVPVKVHIFRTDNGTGGLTENEIASVIDSMNHYYAAANVEFFLCGGINYIDDYLFYDFFQDDEYMLSSYDVAGLINIYFANTVTSSSGGGLCGYAYYPGGYDRILMANSCAVNFSTLPHEMGHFMGLIHTHGPSNSTMTYEFVNGSNCNSEGDLICDTPADPMLSYTNVDVSCFYTGSDMDSNNDLFSPDPTNLMSYSRKYCRNNFSPQQLQVIEYTAHYDRNYFFCNTTSIKEMTAPSKVSVYPVPSAGQVHLDGILQAGQLQVFASDGRLLKSVPVNKGEAQLSIGEMAPGFYFFKVNNQTGKLIRQ